MFHGEVIICSQLNIVLINAKISSCMVLSHSSTLWLLDMFSLLGVLSCSRNHFVGVVI
jgi:hypothetical protein